MRVVPASFLLSGPTDRKGREFYSNSNFLLFQKKAEQIDLAVFSPLIRERWKVWIICGFRTLSPFNFSVRIKRRAEKQRMRLFDLYLRKRSEEEPPFIHPWKGGNSWIYLPSQKLLRHSAWFLLPSRHIICIFFLTSWLEHISVSICFDERKERRKQRQLLNSLRFHLLEDISFYLEPTLTTKFATLSKFQEPVWRIRI